MAVYEGARLRSDGLRATRTGARSTRTTEPRAGTASSRVRPMGLLMAVIVGSTLLGLVYLTQTLDTSATATEIGKMEVQSRELHSKTRILQLEALRRTEADAIIPRARKHELKKLGDIVVLPAP